MNSYIVPVWHTQYGFPCFRCLYSPFALQYRNIENSISTHRDEFSPCIKKNAFKIHAPWCWRVNLTKVNKSEQTTMRADSATAWSDFCFYMYHVWCMADRWMQKQIFDKPIKGVSQTTFINHLICCRIMRRPHYAKNCFNKPNKHTCTMVRPITDESKDGLPDRQTPYS